MANAVVTVVSVIEKMFSGFENHLLRGGNHAIATEKIFSVIEKIFSEPENILSKPENMVKISKNLFPILENEVPGAARLSRALLGLRTNQANCA